MKETLLKMLLTAGDDFVSGEKISQAIGCSRTAVWKHIEELRKSGYEVEAVQRKGYRIVKRPDQIKPHDIQVVLETERFGREITYLESTASTQTVALKLAQEGAKEGHIVLANEQTSGKGRMGRGWYSPPGSSISMSIIFRPQLPPQKAPQLTLLTAVAIVRAIKETTGLDSDIKWPNDLLIDGKKIVGILTEMQADQDSVHSVIQGIGINVNHQEEAFAEEIRKIATSLAIKKGEPIQRAPLIAAILKNIELFYDLYLQHGFSRIKPLWEAHAISIGKRIRARMLNDVKFGVAKGITDDGVLLLEDDDGKLHSIYSADIEIDQ
ncbi:biotin--[acetyl-CoA-carboxylase] ligase [Halalkalibacterium halodurans]|uniref:Bifunctional ligase/repressor BirA n=2 Tax=Halalkalibacterium halodurans TaxID=86665 RepID=Q9KC88_HALH5|nr:biotin--[acetyl-CoA-carboxylase] ligase [Halalkalibacterium halodurans]MDY7222256.1 biotin--[acetyl-CoA-carboxylase] ligase [Halalkalibacterium halodurans]MDY7241477.1 biotin--[acetyl-CoA-carboxylase] ligase [Halalkalibacterium halodurans]MED3646061.1 biotin--[acetyl-CoA-carboxylase] ligase [Halalkalibacterium halodurans]MED4081338.1 biotin--[acetyl-CoA-carboxylase] ligase [Halalkalibacterium halodurans]MED4086877.1 biotin--[acetyl-CoA-carboxylase] ligase [Halalkalibacterium halodurans]